MDTLPDSDTFLSDSVSTLGPSVVYGSKTLSCCSSIRSLVERLFNSGRDFVGVRRHSLTEKQ
ncbi:hypothetical protein LIPSTDRAFT_70379 [Lipomyces starkeyi NRRL Y-11557]|uniref:Uncharacterized protein n=1 Tax=Lipomyces starkeyi NRRL Y-11557 TaxID=675824 RepID=A0A1E3Q750_LIPST|nr:hypothetical protein LIPSTDRAFT_70379 [Lipomyces starkeyi NRRL Y-11557]